MIPIASLTVIGGGVVSVMVPVAEIVRLELRPARSRTPTTASLRLDDARKLQDALQRAIIRAERTALIGALAEGG